MLRLWSKNRKRQPNQNKVVSSFIKRSTKKPGMSNLNSSGYWSSKISSGLHKFMVKSRNLYKNAVNNPHNKSQYLLECDGTSEYTPAEESIGIIVPFLRTKERKSMPVPCILYTIN
jgi:hypothetical protein